MTMDIVSRLPVEIAHQIFSNLDIRDVAACQQSRLTGAITTAISITASASASTTQPQSTSTKEIAVSKTNTPNDNSLSIPVIEQDRDWKNECRTRIMSDRNWANGHIQEVFTLEVHKGPITRLRIKSGKLVSADMFGWVAVWNATTYESEAVIEAAVGPIQLLDFSASAMVMTVVSKSGVCRIWDIKTKTLIYSTAAVDVTCMTMNDDYLIMGSKNGDIQVVDFMTGQVLASTPTLPGEVPLYKHKDERLLIDTRFELPPNLAKQPLIHKTRIPPILTITSIAIGGMHPHVLTTNADRPSLNDAIRVCPVIPRHRFFSNNDDVNEESSTTWRSRRIQNSVPRLPLEDDDEDENEEEEYDIDFSEASRSEPEGIVLTSQDDAISEYLKNCGLKPSFMDVDEDVVVVGTTKGNIVVLHMLPRD
ncbi:hypothetical protein FBU30_003911 [Linnemannia zychae]|nr:hypothetical protein FBU30_003911 [Linnemannia zychae]